MMKLEITRYALECGEIFVSFISLVFCNIRLQYHLTNEIEITRYELEYGEMFPNGNY
jgi:hypothetical protein